jgi:peptidoglycan/LPS O-acetylase OafA/YrhL
VKYHPECAVSSWTSDSTFPNIAGVKYRPDIDGLRAVAIGAVVGFHAFPNHFKGGFVGVDVFFVISGFLISGIILDDLERGRFSYLHFYTRRIRRIFPVLLAVSAMVLAFGWYALLPDEFRALGKHLAAGAGFVSNLAFWQEAGYFDRASDTKPLLHLWSLGVEEQFYILWPLVLGLLGSRTRHFVLIAGAVGIASFAINIALVGSNQPSAFYLPAARFWELMIGGVLAHLTMSRPIWLDSYGNLRCAAGLLLIAVPIFAMTKDAAFPGYWALLPTFGSALVISGNGWINRQVLGNRLMVGIGLISYSLYLWHWPALVFAKLVRGWVLTPTERIEAVALSVVLATATYWTIEKPFRRHTEPRIAGRLAASMAAVAIVGGVAFYGLLPSRLTTEGVSRIVRASIDWEYPPVESENHSFGSLRYFQEASSRDDFTLFLGDSNMEQYAPRVDRAIKGNPSALRGAIFVGNQNGCHILSDIITGHLDCPRALTSLEALLARNTTHALVVAAAWISYRNDLNSESNRSRLEGFLSSASKNKAAYLVLNIPSGPELAPQGMFEGSRLTTMRPKLTPIVFNFSDFQARYAGITKLLIEIAQRSGAKVIDPIAHLCPNHICPVFDATGTPLYLDGGHLTKSYSERSATYIDATLATSASIKP